MRAVARLEMHDVTIGTADLRGAARGRASQDRLAAMGAAGRIMAGRTRGSRHFLLPLTCTRVKGPDVSTSHAAAPSASRSFHCTLKCPGESAGHTDRIPRRGSGCRRPLLWVMSPARTSIALFIS